MNEKMSTKWLQETIKSKLTQQKHNETELTNLLMISILMQVITQTISNTKNLNAKLKINEFDIDPVKKILQQAGVNELFIQEIIPQISSYLNNPRFREDFAEMLSNEIPKDGNFSEFFQKAIQFQKAYTNFVSYQDALKESESSCNTPAFPVLAVGAGPLIGFIVGLAVAGPLGAIIGMAVGPIACSLISLIVILTIRAVENYRSNKAVGIMDANKDFMKFFQGESSSESPTPDDDKQRCLPDFKQV